MFLNLLIEWGRYSRGGCLDLAMMNVGSLFPFYYYSSWKTFLGLVYSDFDFLIFWDDPFLFGILVSIFDPLKCGVV